MQMQASTQLAGVAYAATKNEAERAVIRVTRVDPPLHNIHFVTLYTQGRKPLLADDKVKRLLLDTLLAAKVRLRLDIAGYVILEDHFHLLYIAASGQSLAAIAEALRAHSEHNWRKQIGGSGATGGTTAQPLWDQEMHAYPLTRGKDMHRHLDFVHYDPVRHGLVNRASDYAWSSLPARVHQGHYSEDWAVLAAPAGVVKVARSMYLTN